MNKYIIKENATKGTEFIDSMKKRVKDNGNYCPCRTVKNNDTRCWCKDFRMQDEEGPCHCKLYVKELASYKTTGKYSFKKRFDPQILFHYISDVDHGFRDPVDNIYDIYK